MATATLTLGPADHARRVRFVDFIAADFEEGWLYELARGKVVVTEVAGITHGRVVMELRGLFVRYNADHPGVIQYEAGGAECRIRLPRLESDRHPDYAVYLTPPPPGEQRWTRWTPSLVVEILTKDSRRRDLVEKRDEYLRVGVLEYWVIDPKKREIRVHSRAGDTWEITTLAEGAVHRTHLLPGLEVRPADLLGES